MSNHSNIKNLLLLFIFLNSSMQILLAQNAEKCATVAVAKRLADENPALIDIRKQYEKDIQLWIESNKTLRQSEEQEAVKTIPVVVHVVYKNATENISNAIITSQLNVLNKDFRKLNTDMVPSTHPFFSIAGDAGVEFCLADRKSVV